MSEALDVKQVVRALRPNVNAEFGADIVSVQGGDGDSPWPLHTPDESESFGELKRRFAGRAEAHSHIGKIHQTDVRSGVVSGAIMF